MTAAKSVRVTCSICGRVMAAWPRMRRGYNIAKHNGPGVESINGITARRTCLGYWRTDHELAEVTA